MPVILPAGGTIARADGSLSKPSPGTLSNGAASPRSGRGCTRVGAALAAGNGAIGRNFDRISSVSGEVATTVLTPIASGRVHPAASYGVSSGPFGDSRISGYFCTSSTSRATRGELLIGRHDPRALWKRRALDRRRRRQLRHAHAVEREAAQHLDRSDRIALVLGNDVRVRRFACVLSPSAGGRTDTGCRESSSCTSPRSPASPATRFPCSPRHRGGATCRPSRDWRRAPAAGACSARSSRDWSSRGAAPFPCVSVQNAGMFLNTGM